MEEQRNSMSKSHEQAESECSSSSSSSSSHPCPICLSPTPQLQESYLDRCFRPMFQRKFAIRNGEKRVIDDEWREASGIKRNVVLVADVLPLHIYKFCYKCIVQWTKVVAGKHSKAPSSLMCPFCKTENFSIIHGYDGSSFQRHYVSQIFSDSVFFTEAHRYRLRCYYIEPGILSDAFDIKRFWKSRKYLQSNPWLYSWLKREIQALMQEEDVDVVVHHVLGTIESPLRRDDRRKLKAPEEIQREFKMLLCDAATPFLTGRTARFVNEAELFLASGLNLEAYDDVFMRYLGWKRPETESLEEPTNNNAAILQSLFIFDEHSDGTE